MKPPKENDNNKNNNNNQDIKIDLSYFSPKPMPISQERFPFCKLNSV